MSTRAGILLLVSGPSGSGKTTLCERLEKAGEAYYAVSATTRAPRPGETDREDYFFLSQEEFRQKITEDAFIEHAEVHGNFYGTLKSEILSKLSEGRDVVMDIDVQGADLVRACQDSTIKSALVDLFITVPNETELRSRLTGRQTDSEEVITKRMNNSLEEMTYKGKYTYLLISSDRETDYRRFFSLLEAERMRQLRHA